MITTTHEIRIETSTFCNYRCQMCARDTFRRHQEAMPDALFDSIVAKTRRELPHMSSLTLSGFGEFATDPQWRHKVACASDNFERVHVLTNLSLLRADDIRYLMDHVTDVRVSVYGLDEATYRAVHHPPAAVSYEAIHRSICCLIHRKRPKQRIVLNYVELGDNCHQTADWISYWETKVDLIEVWKPHNWITGKRYRTLDAQRLATCGRPFHGPIQVQVDGTVNVCCFDYNGEMIIGDLRAHSFREVFDGNAMQRIQRLHAGGDADRLPLCRVCDQRNGRVSKTRNAIYSSHIPVDRRVHMTSTDYDILTDARRESQACS